MQGECLNCGKQTHDDKDFCSEECNKQFLEYLKEEMNMKVLEHEERGTIFKQKM